MSTPNYKRPAFDADVAKHLRKPTRLDRVIAKKKAEREADEEWRACCKVVDARDKKACRCCGKPADPNASTLLQRMHRHHIVPRSRGVNHDSSNVISLCAWCHAAIHAAQLRIVGDDANSYIYFEIDEAAVVELFGARHLPSHVRIVMADGDRQVER